MAAKRIDELWGAIFNRASVRKQAADWERGDDTAKAHIAMFGDGLPKLSIADQASGDKKHMLSSLTNAALASGAGTGAPADFVEALLKELALAACAGCPFDATMKERLFMLLRNLDLESARPASVTRQEKQYVAAIRGQILPRSFSQDLGLGVICALLDRVGPDNTAFAELVMQQLSKSLSSEGTSNVVGESPNEMFRQWSPQPEYEAPLDLQSSPLASSPVVYGSLKAAFDGAGRFTSCHMAPGQAWVQIPLAPTREVTSVTVSWTAPASGLLTATLSTPSNPRFAEYSVPIEGTTTHISFPPASRVPHTMVRLVFDEPAPNTRPPFWELRVNSRCDPPRGLFGLFWSITEWLERAASVDSLRPSALLRLLQLGTVSGSLSVLLVAIKLMMASGPLTLPADRLGQLFSSLMYPVPADTSGRSVATSVLEALSAAAVKCRGQPGQLEAPLCIEVSRETIVALTNLMANLLDGPQDELAVAAVGSVVRLLNANLTFLMQSRVDPAAVGLHVSKQSTAESAAAGGAGGLETPMSGGGAEPSIGDGNVGPVEQLVEVLLDMMNSSHPENPERAAALLADHLELFMRTAAGSISAGIFSLFAEHISTPLPTGSHRLRLVQITMAALSGAGGEGLAFNAEDFIAVPDRFMSAEAYVQSSSRASALKQLDTLTSVNPSAGSEKTVDVGGMRVHSAVKIIRPLMREYLYRLLLAGAKNLKSPTPRLETSAVCVALCDAARRLLTHATVVYSEANEGAATGKPPDMEQLWFGMGGSLVLELITGLSMAWRSREVAEAVLPCLVELAPELYKLTAFQAGAAPANASPEDLAGLEGVLKLERMFQDMYSKADSGEDAMSWDVRNGRFLIEILSSVFWLASRLAAVLISGLPLSAREQQLESWLSMPLFSGGVDKSAGMLRPSSAMPGAPSAAPGLRRQQSNRRVAATDNMYYRLGADSWRGMLAAQHIDFNDGSAGIRRSSSVTPSELATSKRQAFLTSLLDSDASGTKGALCSKFTAWFLIKRKVHRLKLRGMLEMKEIEQPLVVAMLSQTGLWQEAQSVVDQLESGAAGASIPCSKRMGELIDEVYKFRRYLRKQQAEFKSGKNAPTMEESKGPDPELETKTADGSEPASMEALMQQLQARAEFLMTLSPVSTTTGGGRRQMNAVLSSLAHLDTEVLKERGQGALLEWNSVVQDAFRGQGLMSPTADPDDDDVGEEEEETKSEVSADVAGLLMSCVHYMQHGGPASPGTLADIMKRRRTRANQRTRGLYAMACLLSSTHLPALLSPAILLIRPAFNGGFSRSTVEIAAHLYAHVNGGEPGMVPAAGAGVSAAGGGASESGPGPAASRKSAAPRNTHSRGDGTDSGNIFEAHHPMQHLESSPLEAQERVRTAFRTLYAILVPMFARCLAGQDDAVESRGRVAEVPCFSRLACSLSWAWALDFDGGRDFRFITETGLLSALLSVIGVKEHARCAKLVQDSEAATPGPGAATVHPWARRRVHTSLLSGTLPKRELVWHMRHVAASPEYAGRLAASWWADHDLTGPIKDVVERVDSGTLLYTYDKFLATLFQIDAAQMERLTSAVPLVATRLHDLRKRRIVGSSFLAEDAPTRASVAGSLSDAQGRPFDEKTLAAAYATAAATSSADEQLGGLSAGGGASVPVGLRRCVWALYRLLSLFAVGGAATLRKQHVAKEEEDTTKPTSPLFLSEGIKAAAVDGLLVDFEATVDALLVAGDDTGLEPLELERHLFGLLRHLHHLVQLPAGAKLLTSSNTLRLLITCIMPASRTLWDTGGDVSEWSPRCRRIALLTVVSLCTVASPAEVKDAMHEAVRKHTASGASTSTSHQLRTVPIDADHGLEHLLILMAGESLCGGDPPVATRESMCDAGPGAAKQAFAAEAAAALLNMAQQNKEWQAAIGAVVMASVGRVHGLLAKLTPPENPDNDISHARLTSSLSAATLSKYDLWRAAASLALLGGPPECLRVGGTVRVGSSAEGAVGTVVAIGRNLADEVIAAGLAPTAEADSDSLGDTVSHAAEGAAAHAGLGRVVVAFDHAVENVGVHGLMPVSDSDQGGQGSSTSFLLALAGAGGADADDTLVPFFKEALALPSPHIVSAIEACKVERLKTDTTTAMVYLTSVGAVTQLKLFSLRALPLAMRRPSFQDAAVRHGLLPVLLKAALLPLRVPSLLTLESLEARRATLLRWLLEATQPGGARLFTPPDALAEAVVHVATTSSGSSAEFATGDPTRDAIAGALSSLTGGDDKGSSNLVDRRTVEAQRLTIATNLSQATAKPVKLCLAALELYHEPQAAAEWLFSGKADGWAEEPSESKEDDGSWTCSLCTFSNGATVEVCEMCANPKPAGGAGGSSGHDHGSFSNDAAAVEGIAEAPPLFDDPSAASKPSLEKQSSFAPTAGRSAGAPPRTMSRLLSSRNMVSTLSTRDIEGSAGPADNTASVLDSIGLRYAKLVPAPDTVRGGELDGQVPLWPGMAVAAGVQPGPASARFRNPGVVSAVEPSKFRAMVKFWDEESGACVTVLVPFRRPVRAGGPPTISLMHAVRVGGASAGNAASIAAALAITDMSLATHYARRAVVEVCGTEKAINSLSLSSPTAGAGGAGGGSLGIEPSDLLALTKLVAASENECGRDAGSQNATARTPLMTALLSLLRRLLAIEMQDARDRMMGVTRRPSRTSVASGPARSKSTASQEQWACQLCTLLNPWSAAECTMCQSARPADLEEPEPEPERPVTRLRPGALGLAFVQECSENVEAATQVQVEAKDGDGDDDKKEDKKGSDVITLESLHPHPPKAAYGGVVHLKGASALRVVFDNESFKPASGRGSNADVSLTFWTDPSRQTVLRVVKGDALDLSPFVVHSDTLVYAFKDTGGSPPCWGYRVVVSPIWRLQWLREEQVLSSPSLEWGMWLMQFLMKEAPEVAATGALHDKRVFDALVVYLRSPAVPYKSRVIALLSQLLSSPHLFSTTDPPNLAALNGVRRLVEERAREEQSRKHLFLPTRLMQLTQLTVLARRAESGVALLPVNPNVSGGLRPPFATAARVKTLESQSVEETLMELLGITESILYHRRMPDAVYNAAYKSATGSFSTNASAMTRVVRGNASWTTEEDVQVARWLSDVANRTDADPTKVPVKTLSLQRVDGNKYTLLTGVPVEKLRLRVAVLQLFNQRLAKVLSFIDLAEEGSESSRRTTAMSVSEAKTDDDETVAMTFDSRWSLGAKIRAIGHCVFLGSKLPLLQQCVESTVNSSRPSTQYLHRGKALVSKNRGVTNPAASQCLFVQSFNLLNKVNPALLRAAPDSQKEYLFPVKFKTFNARGGDEDEPGSDWGGLYREALNTFVEDLFDPETLSLCIPVPNARNHVGVTDAFVPNPSMTSPNALAMFEWVGKLMGISLRHKSNLPFRFPSIVWKRLSGRAVDLSDLEAIDQVFVRFLKQLRSGEVGGAALSTMRFVVMRSDEVQVPLMPGGAQIVVTEDNVQQYCDAMESFRRHEFDLQSAAILRGLAQLVPPRALPLFTWDELENLVCGDRTVDASLMRRHTTYIRPYNDSDPVVKRFWNVFESFTNEERVLFIRFAWGRSRLPAAGRWGKERNFKLSKLTKRGVDDNSLPLAHACFFNLELPPYTTEAIMKKRLLVAMHYSIGYYGIV